MNILLMDVQDLSLHLLLFLVDHSQIILHELFYVQVLISGTLGSGSSGRVGPSWLGATSPPFASLPSHLCVLLFYLIHLFLLLLSSLSLLFSTEDVFRAVGLLGCKP